MFQSLPPSNVKPASIVGAGFYMYKVSIDDDDHVCNNVINHINNLEVK